MIQNTDIIILQRDEHRKERSTNRGYRVQAVGLYAEGHIKELYQRRVITR